MEVSQGACAKKTQATSIPHQLHGLSGFPGARQDSPGGQTSEQPQAHVRTAKRRISNMRPKSLMNCGFVLIGSWEREREIRRRISWGTILPKMITVRVFFRISKTTNIRNLMRDYFCELIKTVMDINSLRSDLSTITDLAFFFFRNPS